MRRVGFALGLLSTALSAQGPCNSTTPMSKASVVSAGIGLGLDLLKIQPESQTALLAPAVIESMLLALQQGSLGRTRRELFQVIPSNVSTEALGCLLHEWSQPGTTPNEPSSGLRIELSGRIWVRPGVDLQKDFQEELTERLQWSAEAADFSQPGARQAINSWVAKQTGGKVAELFTERMVGPTTQLVLASTALFRGKWALPFDSSATRPGSFQTTRGESVPAQMMQLEAFLPYAKRPGEQIVLLPIQGQEQRWALMIVLPNRDSAHELAAKLESGAWSQWLASTQSRFISLTFPRLKLQQRVNLVDDLEKLGVRTLFTPEADLSGISSTPGLYVGAAATEAVLEVNETGLLAAAGAGAAIRTLALREPPERTEVVVDRPFLFAIVDRLTGALLFVGRCEEPGVS
jgi:serpin B